MNYSKILIISGILLLALTGLSFTEPETAPPKIYIANINNYVINPIVKDYISEAIKTSEAENAQCLIIQLDTPGGLLESTREIVKSIVNSKIPVVVYVYPQGSRAASAGVFITLSAHVAVMTNSTHIGAAHPVGLVSYKSKEKSDENVMKDKILNDTIAWITTIAKNRNRNASWAKRAVEESESITAKQAVKQKVVDFIARDLDDLLVKLNGKKININSKDIILNTKNANIINLELTPSQKLLNIIIHPQIAYILMLLGFLGLLFEITHPGVGFPGIAGLICLTLAFYAFNVIPINYAGLALIILGLILFIAEALTPTFGLLTLGGLTCMVLGSLMLVKSPFGAMRISLKVILPFVISIAGITIFLLGTILKTHVKKIKTGKEGLIGQTATAIGSFKNKGKIFVHGEIWQAKNISKTKINKNDNVTIQEVKGLTLYVKKERET
ncbi:MAG TPA: nodulation protein NfeD [Candidatus Omnitrophica bacterium]|nr:nodulation protein NfeD [Candidatus Omnitrophota bacterium]